MGSDNNKGENLSKASLPLQVMYTLQTASRSTHHPSSPCRDVSARICLLYDILIHNLSSIELLPMRTHASVLQILIFFNGVWLVLFWAVSTKALTQLCRFAFGGHSLAYA